MQLITSTRLSLTLCAFIYIVSNNVGTTAYIVADFIRNSKLTSQPTSNAQSLHRSTIPSFSHLWSTTKTSTDVTTTTTALPETRALPPHTFAGMVERRLIEKFTNNDDDDASIERILTSWRLLEQDYVHKEYITTANDDDKGIDNYNYQLANSYVPGLSIKQFWETSQYTWCQQLQKKFKVIRKEFLQVKSMLESGKLQGNNIWAGALTQDASSYGVGWKTLVLMDRGVWDATNVALFPQTAKAIHDANVPAVEVFFASMQANSRIEWHSDYANFVLTCHLPLVVPYSGQNKCRLSIGDDERQWIDGQVMLFDTSIMHNAVNESDQMRYILMMRVWHPDLTQVERQALQFTYDALMEPAVVSDDPEERAKAEAYMKDLHEFPQVSSSLAKNKAQGFGGKGSDKLDVNKKAKQKNKKVR